MPQIPEASTNEELQCISGHSSVLSNNQLILQCLKEELIIKIRISNCGMYMYISLGIKNLRLWVKLNHFSDSEVVSSVLEFCKQLEKVAVRASEPLILL